jgi:hypothetical protein
MLQVLKNVASTLLSQYGTEVALVGKVAIAALIPAGAGILVEKGFEALCEYISDRVTHENKKYIEELDQQQLAQALIKLNQSGLMHDVVHLRNQGLNTTQITQTLQNKIDHSPSMLDLRHDFISLNAHLKEIDARLKQLNEQMVVVIQGQEIQVNHLNQMMHLMQQIANQMGIESTPTSTIQSQQTPKKKITIVDLTEDQMKPILDQAFLNLASAESESQISVNHTHSLFSRFQQKQAQKQTQQTQEQAPSTPSNGYEIILEQINAKHEVAIIQYLCNDLGHQLSKALMIVQSLPQIIIRTDQRAEITKIQREISALGANINYRRCTL